jgi:hypothetical protein
MTVRLNRRTPPADTAAKAAAIARDGGYVALAGDGRYLRRVRDLLAGEAGVSTFLDVKELHVSPPTRRRLVPRPGRAAAQVVVSGGWERERV